MQKMTFRDIKIAIQILKAMRLMLESGIPKEEMNIYTNLEDKRLLDTIDLSEYVVAIDECIEETLNEIDEKLADIYTNAVDEREGLPTNSMSKRALWLDEVQLLVDNLRRV